MSTNETNVVAETVTTPAANDVKARKPRSANGPNVLEFCQIWQNAANVQEVCDKTGMNYNAAVQRAAGYRKKGAKLKTFAGGGAKRINFEEINAALNMGGVQNPENQQS